VSSPTSAEAEASQRRAALTLETAKAMKSGLSDDEAAEAGARMVVGNIVQGELQQGEAVRAEGCAFGVSVDSARAAYLVVTDRRVLSTFIWDPSPVVSLRFDDVVRVQSETPNWLTVVWKPADLTLQRAARIVGNASGELDSVFGFGQDEKGVVLRSSILARLDG